MSCRPPASRKPQAAGRRAQAERLLRSRAEWVHAASPAASGRRRRREPRTARVPVPAFRGQRRPVQCCVRSSPHRWPLAPFASIHRPRQGGWFSRAPARQRLQRPARRWYAGRPRQFRRGRAARAGALGRWSQGLKPHGAQGRRAAWTPRFSFRALAIAHRLFASSV